MIWAVGVVEHHHRGCGVGKQGAETDNADDANEESKPEDKGEDEFIAEGDLQAPDDGHRKDKDDDVGPKTRFQHIRGEACRKQGAVDSMQRSGQGITYSVLIAAPAIQFTATEPQCPSIDPSQL